MGHSKKQQNCSVNNTICIILICFISTLLQHTFMKQCRTNTKPYKVDKTSNNSVVYQQTFLARRSYLNQQETSCTSATTRYRSTVVTNSQRLWPFQVTSAFALLTSQYQRLHTSPPTTTLSSIRTPVAESRLLTTKKKCIMPFPLQHMLLPHAWELRRIMQQSWQSLKSTISQPCKTSEISHRAP